MTSTLPSRRIPIAFEAWEECAAYVNASRSRSQAITEARDCHWPLKDEFLRRELRVRRVWMRAIEGQEAEEFFDGDMDSGWVEVAHRPLNAAQRANLTPMWKVEPR